MVADLRPGVYVNDKNSKKVYVVEEVRADGSLLVHDADEELTNGYAVGKLLKSDKLVVIPPVVFAKQEVMDIVRYEEDSIYHIFEKCNYPENVTARDTVKIGFADLLSAVTVMKKSKVSWQNLIKWRMMMEGLSASLGLSLLDLYDDENKLSLDLLEECFCLNYAWTVLNGMLYESDGIHTIRPEDDFFEEIIDLLLMFMENKGLPVRKRQFPWDLMVRFVELYDDSNIDDMPVETQELYRELLDRLCKENYPSALYKKAYCLYNGTKILPKNLSEAADIFEAYYRITADPLAANILGYINFYGRDGKVKPDYEKAFYYFTIAYCGGNLQSGYKLGDMFLKGLGVEKNEDTALFMYVKLYEECKELFLGGEKDGFFPDLAYRMAKCFYYGYGTETDICQAYRYYLEADYSLRKRMENHERSGDKSLYSRVRKLLREIRTDYMESMGEEYIFDPVFFDELIVSGRKVCMSYKKSKKGGYKLSFKLLPFPWEDSVPPFLETIPRENYCGLTNKIRIRTGKDSRLHMPVKAKKVYFDMVSTDPLLDGMIIFELDHKVVATLNVDKIIRLAPKEDDVIEEVKERSFLIAMVRFKKGGKIYEYLADDLDIEAGDKVIVSSYDEETVVEVVDVVKKDESELSLRISEYGHILKKV